MFEESKISTTGGQLSRWLPTETPWWWSLKKRDVEKEGMWKKKIFFEWIKILIVLCEGPSSDPYKIFSVIWSKRTSVGKGKSIWLPAVLGGKSGTSFRMHQLLKWLLRSCKGIFFRSFFKSNRNERRFIFGSVGVLACSVPELAWHKC